MPLSPHVAPTRATAPPTVASATVVAPVVRSAASSPAPVEPAAVPIPPSPTLDAQMDLPPLHVPLFVPEPAVPSASFAPAASSATAPPVSPVPRPGVEASCHNPANASDSFALLRQQKLAGLEQWRASIVARVGAETAAAILTDVDAALPSIVDDPAISLRELSVTCAALDERLLGLATTYASNRSLSLLQASLDRTAARLARPSMRASTPQRVSSQSPPPRSRSPRSRSRRRSSTNRRRRRRNRRSSSSSSPSSSSSESSSSDSEEDRSPSPSLRRRVGADVSRAVSHGRRVRMTPVWDNALQCGGGWIAWKQRFLSELELSAPLTESQKLAELRNNVVPELCSFLNWDMERHRPLSTLQEGLDVLANLYASSYALNPKQIFASKVAQLRQEPAESMAAYLAKANALCIEYAAESNLRPERHRRHQQAIDSWACDYLMPAFLRGLQDRYANLRDDRSKRWGKFCKRMLRRSVDVQRQFAFAPASMIPSSSVAPSFASVAAQPARLRPQAPPAASAAASTSTSQLSWKCLPPSACTSSNVPHCSAADACIDPRCRLWHPSPRSRRLAGGNEPPPPGVSRPTVPPRTSAAVPNRPKCTHCQQFGHVEARCFQLHPNLRPPPPPPIAPAVPVTPPPRPPAV